ncbi:MAG TPA: hypothetical protein VHL10_00925 [Nitrososphaera sp.]|nr:hypothetical protein [Nitrososphaera sp.]
MEIGDEAKRFLESDLGRCILGIVEQDSEKARQGLELVDPQDTKSVTALQKKAQMSRMFKNYVVELFERGEAALEVWKNENRRVA